MYQDIEKSTSKTSNYTNQTVEIKKQGSFLNDEQRDSNRLKTSMMMLSDELSEEKGINYESMIYKRKADKADKAEKMSAKLPKALEEIGPWEPQKSNHQRGLNLQSYTKAPHHLTKYFQKSPNTNVVMDNQERAKSHSAIDGFELLESESKHFLLESKDSLIMGQSTKKYLEIPNPKEAFSLLSSSYTKSGKNSSYQSTNHSKCLDEELRLDPTCDLSFSKGPLKPPIIQYPLQPFLTNESTNTKHLTPFLRNSIGQSFQKYSARSSNFFRTKRPLSRSTKKNFNIQANPSSLALLGPKVTVSNISRYNSSCDKSESDIELSQSKPEKFDLTPAEVHKKLDQLNQQPHQEPNYSQIEFKTLFQNTRKTTQQFAIKSQLNQVVLNSDIEECSYIGLSKLKRVQDQSSLKERIEERSKTQQQSRAMYTYPLFGDTDYKTDSEAGKQSQVNKQPSKIILSLNHKIETPQSQSKKLKTKRLLGCSQASVDKNPLGLSTTSSSQRCQTLDSCVANRAQQEITSLIEILRNSANMTPANFNLISFAQRQQQKLIWPSTSSTSIRSKSVTNLILDGSVLNIPEMRAPIKQKTKKESLAQSLIPLRQSL